MKNRVFKTVVILLVSAFIIELFISLILSSVLNMTISELYIFRNTFTVIMKAYFALVLLWSLFLYPIIVLPCKKRKIILIILGGISLVVFLVFPIGRGHSNNWYK